MRRGRRPRLPHFQPQLQMCSTTQARQRLVSMRIQMWSQLVN